MRGGLLLLASVLTGCAHGPRAGTSACPRDRVLELGLPEDVTRAVGCSSVIGMRIRTGATIDASPLSSLEEIRGDLEIGPTVGVDTIALNGLVRVGGTIRVVTNGSLRGVFLPRLESVGRIEIENNPVLTTVSVPRLAAVESSVVLTNNEVLELVSATSLTRVGADLVVVDHPRLNLLEMAQLDRVQNVRIENTPNLPQDVADRLRAAAQAP